MDSPAACQARCSATDGCGYFSFVTGTAFTCTDGEGDAVSILECALESADFAEGCPEELCAAGTPTYHECFLKRAYTEPLCMAQGYVPWSLPTGWYGVSGPAECAAAAAPTPSEASHETRTAAPMLALVAAALRWCVE